MRLLTKLRDHTLEGLGEEVTSIHSLPMGAKPGDI
jgi:hypothetical protein